MTYKISISTPNRSSFDGAVKILKKAKGKFDPTTKSWTVTIDADEADLRSHLDAYNPGRAYAYLPYMTVTELADSND